MLLGLAQRLGSLEWNRLGRGALDGRQKTPDVLPTWGDLHQYQHGRRVQGYTAAVYRPRLRLGSGALAWSRTASGAEPWTGLP